MGLEGASVNTCISCVSLCVCVCVCMCVACGVVRVCCVCVCVCVRVCRGQGYMFVRKSWGEHRRAEASTQCDYTELCVLVQWLSSKLVEMV